MFNLNQKTFKAVANSENGRVSSSTRFHYHQEGDLVWGEYHGGAIRLGRLVGVVEGEDRIRFSYSHVDRGGEIMTGNCVSHIAIGGEGRLLLNEEWEWTCGDRSRGKSQIIEIHEA